MALKRPVRLLLGFLVGVWLTTHLDKEFAHEPHSGLEKIQGGWKARGESEDEWVKSDVTTEIER